MFIYLNILCFLNVCKINTNTLFRINLNYISLPKKDEAVNCSNINSDNIFMPE